MTPSQFPPFRPELMALSTSMHALTISHERTGQTRASISRQEIPPAHGDESHGILWHLAQIVLPSCFLSGKEIDESASDDEGWGEVLFSALQRKNVEDLRQVIRMKRHLLNKEDMGGDLPFITACKLRFYVGARLLLEDGPIDPTYAPWGCQSPLEYALEEGDSTALQLFSQHGVDLQVLMESLIRNEKSVQHALCELQGNQPLSIREFKRQFHLPFFAGFTKEALRSFCKAKIQHHFEQLCVVRRALFSSRLHERMNSYIEERRDRDHNLLREEEFFIHETLHRVSSRIQYRKLVLEEGVPNFQAVQEELLELVDFECELSLKQRFLQEILGKERVDSLPNFYDTPLSYFRKVGNQQMVEMLERHNFLDLPTASPVDRGMVLPFHLRPRPSFVSGFIRLHMPQGTYNVCVTYLQRIGKGTFKNVYSVTIACRSRSGRHPTDVVKGTNTQYALSILNHSSRLEQRLLLHEVQVSSVLGKINLPYPPLPLHLVTSSSCEAGTLAPLCNQGTLHQLLSQYHLTRLQRLTIAALLSRMFMDWHRLHVCHLDVKSTNILVRSRPGGRLDFFLTDYSTVQTTEAVGPDKLPQPVMVRLCSTYPAPEMVQNVLEGKKTRASPLLDQWAFGELLYELMFKRSFLHHFGLDASLDPSSFFELLPLLYEAADQEICGSVLKHDGELEVRRAIFRHFNPAQTRVTAEQDVNFFLKEITREQQKSREHAQLPK